MNAMSEKKQTSLDEWYKSNNEQLEKNRQKQLEETYINKELMAKYLGQDMKVSGLSDSGIAELYKQKSNTDYMNNRAQVNSNYEAQQQSLSNQYFAAKKEEEDIANAKLEQEKKEAQLKEDADKAKQESELKYNQSIYDAYLDTDYSNMFSQYDSDKDGKLTKEQADLMKEYITNNYTDKASQIAIELYLKGLDNSIETEDEAVFRDVFEKEQAESMDAIRKDVEIQADKEYISKNISGVDTNDYIIAKDAGVLSFGSKYNDAGTGKGSQDKWINYIINAANNGQLKNGIYVDFDFGGTQDKGNSIYLYYNGVFYKTNKMRDVTNDIFDKLLFTAKDGEIQYGYKKQGKFKG
jgi:hypothetical protein